MECRDIRDKLSFYLDGDLPSGDKSAIEEHLKSCTGCSAALADLRKTIGHIKDLAELEPPEWMTRRIMEKVRAEAPPKKGILQRLFYPLHIKLPIEAVVTVLVVGIALYIYRDIRPEMKLAKSPVEESAPQGFRKEPQPSLPLPVLPSPHSGGFAGAKDKGKEEGLSLKRGRGGFSEERNPSLPKHADQPVLSVKRDANAGKVETTRDVQGRLEKEESPPSPAREMDRIAPAVAAKEDIHQGAREAAPKAKLSVMEKKDEKVLSLTVLVKDLETAAGEVEKIVKGLEGKVVRVESTEGKQIITAEVNASNLNDLIGRLRSVGQVKEKDIDFKGAKGEIGIRIEVVSIPEGR